MRPPTSDEPTENDDASLREQMVENQLRRRGIADPRVLAAMEEVPRHEFVPEELRWAAYLDRPLSIGFQQTISQPLIVAVMLEAARLRGHERVLDVGTGSGYQAALLSRLCREVQSIEVIPELADRARTVLARLGMTNVTVIAGDGSEGWPEAAPYDAILVAAAAREIPPALLDQLAVGGRLVIPVGPSYSQVLTVAERTPAGVRTEELDLCAFVPLVGSYRPR